MNTALAILAHALRMLIFDIPTTFRVLSPTFVLVIGCGIAIDVFAGDLVDVAFAPSAQVPVAPSASASLSLLLFGSIGLMGYALMAILWHRHVLLNGAERQDVLRPSASVFFGYLWRAIVLGCVQLVAAVPIAVGLGALAALLGGADPSALSTTMIGLLGSVVFIWLALRLSVVLPAAAMGERLSIVTSWTLTAPVSGILWGLTALLTGLNVLVSVVVQPVLPVSGMAAVVGQTVVFVLEGLVFVSVLTTLYGHLVEGRSLGQDRTEAE